MNTHIISKKTLHGNKLKALFTKHIQKAEQLAESRSA